MEVAKVAKLNERLKAANIRTRIMHRGNKLYLRATFPPKEGELHWKQREISLNVNANPTGLKFAFEEAKRIALLLDSGEFVWERPKPRQSMAELMAAFETKYFETRPVTHASTRTFIKDYRDVLNKLQHPTLAAMRSLVLTTEPDTRKRKRYALACGKFADFLGLDGKGLRQLGGGYGLRQLNPRQLPSDREIFNAWRSLPDELQWGFGMMACYGLRPHELYLLDWQRPMLHVNKGKSNQRVVFPFPARWERLIPLGKPPKTRQKGNANRGAFVGKVFKRHLNFHLYDLRHAWAVRSLEAGLDITLAAKQMGHSVKVHNEIYHHWIDADVHRRAWENINQLSVLELPQYLPLNSLQN